MNLKILRNYLHGALCMRAILFRVKRKYLIMIKLTLAFSTLFSLTALAEGYSQSITLNMRNTSVKAVLKEVKKQTDFDIFYNVELISSLDKKDVVLKNASLADVLKVTLAHEDVDFTIENKTVLIFAGADRSKQQQLTGTVVDEEGAPLQGVTVSLKGTTVGTTTDAEGAFQLRATDANAVVIFRMLGYKDQEVSANERSLNITLVKSISGLDDVVVTGYGTSSKRKVNSSISTLDMSNVAKIPVQSINDGIAGRIHGVIVTSSSGAPGAKSSISIRGAGAPLYVIDNVIRSANDFSNLNPNDIESYSVLKDAAATAQYGAQGGNGVVVVTTKQGKEGVTSINYSYNHILSQPTIFPKRLSSYETLKAINEVYSFEGRQKPTPDDILEYYRTQEKPFEYPNTDWQKVGLKSHAAEKRHDLSMTSGTDRLKYYASTSYYKQGTNLRTDNNSNERITYRLNTVSNLKELNLKVMAGIDGYVEMNEMPNSSTGGSYAAIYQHIQQKRASQLAYNEFGLPSANTTDNPAVELSNESGYARNNSRIFNGLLSFEYDAHFLQGLKFKFNGNYNMWNSKSKSWNLTAPSYSNNSTTPLLGNPPSLSAGRGDGSTMLLQGYVMFNRSFGDHNIDFTGVYEQAQNLSTSLSATRQQYQIIHDQFVAGPTVNQLGNGSESESGRAGYVGRLSYSYKGKYFLDGSLRHDGLDLFPKNKQWGTFYALSGGYTLSEEDFFQTLKDRNILNYLKIRGSYGLVGSAEGIGAFQYVSGYVINPNTWVIDDVPVQGTSEPGSLPSTNFSWYNIRERNFGFDFETLSNRLSGSFDYFYKRTTGYVVADTRYSAPLGIGLPPINFEEAAHRRHGAEFNLAWQDNKGDLSYKVGVNFTYFNQLWERTTNEDEAALKNPWTRNSGNPYQAYGTGYINDGFYTNNLDLLVGPRRISSIDVIAGDLRYQDINGDGKLDGSDQIRMGNPDFPRINFGTTVDLGYKGWSFSAVIMGSGNRDRYIGGVVQGSNLESLLTYGFQHDYWRLDNQDALYPRQVSTPGVNGSNNYVTSDFWLLPSRFVRLKYLQIGYDLKQGPLANSKFKTMRVFLSGTNLLTFSNSKKYFVDPESNQNNEGYPIQRTFAVGVSVGF